MARPQPILNRDDPDKAPLSGNIKVTREDWLNLARDVLVTEGVGELKILSLSGRLGVSRSSFYWYFENRADLLGALLDEWEARNTRLILSHCEKAARNITEAVCNFFRCFVDPDAFDQGLDFAVREWSRRDPSLRDRVDRADAARLAAVAAMFREHGYPAPDAEARARILYFMQLGYHALDMREPMQVRLIGIFETLQGFTGQTPDPDVIAAFSRFALSKE